MRKYLNKTLSEITLFKIHYLKIIIYKTDFELTDLRDSLF